MNKEELLVSCIEHTYLRDEERGASLEEQAKEVKNLVHEALEAKCWGVCVRPQMVKLVSQLFSLKENAHPLAIVTTVGFPVVTSLDSTLRELEEALDLGADEFDTLFPHDLFFAKKYNEVVNYFVKLQELCSDKTLKIILENSKLTNIDDKRRAYELVKESFDKNPSNNVGLRFFKTNTGYFGQAQVDDVELMSVYAQGKYGIKPAGGIKLWSKALEFFYASGAKMNGPKVDLTKFRIGSSALVKDYLAKKKLVTEKSSQSPFISSSLGL